jgi:hypothetical protein
MEAASGAAVTAAAAIADGEQQRKAVGGWKPRHHYTDSDVVRLPGGEIAGWLAVR